MTLFDTDLGEVAAPTFIVDRSALRANFALMRDATGGMPLRIASKSVRVRSIVEWALEQDEVVGVLAYSAAEALWLVENEAHDVVVGYPSVDGATMRAVAADPRAREQITFMIDLPEHVRMLAAAAQTAGTQLRACLDVDASLRIGRAHLGTHRSSVHTPEEAAAIARLVSETAGVRLVGLMMYEAQVAGVADLTPFHVMMKRRSVDELARRRGQVRRAIERYADLEFVNGGGTGSAHLTSADATVTDIAVGSGLFTSTHYDGYRDLTTQPAAWFVSPVVRKPAADVAVTFCGGYLASGPGTSTRLPTPVWPPKLRYFAQEGAGEVQTPLHGAGARGLRVGDPVWFRHTKAGEACERFDTVTMLENGQVVDVVPTYRGEGKNYG